MSNLRVKLGYVDFSNFFSILGLRYTALPHTHHTLRGGGSEAASDAELGLTRLLPHLVNIIFHCCQLMGMSDCVEEGRSLRPQAEPMRLWAAGSKGCGGGIEFVSHSESIFALSILF